MKRHLWTDWGVGILGLLLGCGPTIVDQESSWPAADPPYHNQLAPDIQSALVDGTPFQLRQQGAGKVVLLSFWATWCGPCIMEMPELIELAEEYADRGVVLYAVNGGESPGTIRQFLERRPWKVAIVLDEEGRHSRAYRVSGIPHLVMLDRNGVLRKTHVGYDPEGQSTLRRELEEVLAIPADKPAAPVNGPAPAPPVAPSDPPSPAAT